MTRIPSVGSAPIECAHEAILSRTADFRRADLHHDRRWRARGRVHRCNRVVPVMTTDRKKPGAALWATVIVIAALASQISFGPWCWIVSRYAGVRAVPVIYRPTMMLAHESETARRATTWYAKLFAAEHWVLYWTPGDKTSAWLWAREIRRRR